MQRYVGWDEDFHLQESLKKYVSAGYKRTEILSFVSRDFPQYPWSLRSVDRRLRHFGIYYTDHTVDVEDVQQAVAKELDGPGKLLGYRAMHKKVRQVHHLNVPRKLVNEVMYDLDAEGLEERALATNRPRVRGNFTTKGVNWVHAMDGHAKLMGFQKSTFPLGVYGCIDTASRKLLWLRVWTGNSDPKLIGRFYLDHLYESRMIAGKIRIDKGTETGKMATLHAFLRRHHGDMDPLDTVIYGPSTANQIERWWRELHQRLEKYFKEHLLYLKDRHHYDPHSDIDRSILAYLFVPLIQREVDIFKDVVWNAHRIRCQKETYPPDGVPDHIHCFPEEYQLEQCGFEITSTQLEEAAIESGVLEGTDDYISEELREKCENILPNPDQVAAKDCATTFIFLKERYIAQHQDNEINMSEMF